MSKININTIRNLFLNLSKESILSWEQTFAHLENDDKKAIEAAIPALRILEDAFIDRRGRRRRRPAE